MHWLETVFQDCIGRESPISTSHAGSAVEVRGLVHQLAQMILMRERKTPPVSVCASWRSLLLSRRSRPKLVARQRFDRQEDHYAAGDLRESAVHPLQVLQLSNPQLQ